MKNRITFKQLKKDLLRDPGFKARYKALQPEFELLSLMIEKRIAGGMTQKALADKIGTKQSAISRFESGKYNPTLAFLHKLADALDVKLKITVTK